MINLRFSTLPLTALLLPLLALPTIAAEPAIPRPASELSFTQPGRAPEQISEYKGKVIAVEFLLTTCPHCQAASKVMTQLQHELGPRGFQTVGVAVNAGAAGLVAQFVTQFQVGYPVGFADPQAALKFLDLTPRRLLFPQLVLVDRSGEIRYQSPAAGDPLFEDPAALRHEIESLLAPVHHATQAKK